LQAALEAHEQYQVCMPRRQAAAHREAKGVLRINRALQAFADAARCPDDEKASRILNIARRLAVARLDELLQRLTPGDAIKTFTLALLRRARDRQVEQVRRDVAEYNKRGVTPQVDAALLAIAEELRGMLRRPEPDPLTGLGEEVNAAIAALELLGSGGSATRPGGGAIQKMHDRLDDLAVTGLLAIDGLPGRPDPLKPLSRSQEVSALRRLQHWLASRGRPQRRLIIDVTTRTVVLDGITYGGLDVDAVNFLKQLQCIAPKPRSGTALLADCGLGGDRADRLLKKLPEPLRNIVRSKTGTGYWLELHELD
jgi:hypothetical protein